MHADGVLDTRKREEFKAMLPQHLSSRMRFVEPIFEAAQQGNAQMVEEGLTEMYIRARDEFYANLAERVQETGLQGGSVETLSSGPVAQVTQNARRRAFEDDKNFAHDLTAGTSLGGHASGASVFDKDRGTVNRDSDGNITSSNGPRPMWGTEGGNPDKNN
jgi:hypothetical protein